MYGDRDALLTLTWKLARWAERPSPSALEVLLADLARRDHAVLEAIAPAPARAVAN
jgi:hypothetical protein